MTQEHDVAVFAAVLEEPGVAFHEIAAATGLGSAEVGEALAALRRRRYIDGQFNAGDNTILGARSVLPTAEGRSWHERLLAGSAGTPAPAAVHDVWASRVIPLLNAVAAREGTGNLVTVEDLAEGTGLTHDQVDAELIRLIDADYIDVADYSKTMAAGQKGHWKLLSPVLTEKGARTIGLWPTNDPYDALIQLLERKIAEEPNEERKSKWRRLRDDAGDIGKGTMSGLLVEMAKLAAAGIG